MYTYGQLETLFELELLAFVKLPLESADQYRTPSRYITVVETAIRA